jgi:hypothetical protein
MRSQTFGLSPERSDLVRRRWAGRRATLTAGNPRPSPVGLSRDAGRRAVMEPPVTRRQSVVVRSVGRL